jgi:hypothetical protein
LSSERRRIATSAATQTASASGHARAAAVEHHAVVALDEQRELAGVEQSLILCVSRIVHRGRSQLGHVPILRGSSGHLAPIVAGGHPRRVEEEQASGGLDYRIEQVKAGREAENAA